MFEFMDMIGNYEERKVDRFSKGNLIVDTCSVTDSDKPFETAVKHPKFNQEKWIVVELYDTKEEAQEGHNKWIKIMTAEKLPLELKDISSAKIAKLCDAVTEENWRTRLKEFTE